MFVLVLISDWGIPTHFLMRELLITKVGFFLILVLSNYGHLSFRIMLAIVAFSSVPQ